MPPVAPEKTDKDTNKSGELDSELKGIIDAVRSGEKSAADGLHEILAHCATKGELKEAQEAIEQIEQWKADVEQDIQKKLDNVRRQAWSPSGTYRGVFANEEEARAFGLLVMSRSANIDGCEQVAQRAGEALKRDFPEIHQRAMGSGAGDAGSALVTPEFSTRLIRLVENFGKFESNAFTMPMQGDQLAFFRRTTGLSVFLVGEGNAPTESSPGYARVVLNAKEWGTLTFYPRTLDEDAAMEIGELIAMEVAQAFASKTDDIGFNGDGTESHFGIKGLRQRLLDVYGTSGGEGLIQGSGSSWSALTSGDFDSVQGSLPDFDGVNPQFYCHRKFFFTVMVPIIESGGGVTVTEMEGRRRLNFRGDPVEIVQKMPKSSASQHIPLLYGDLRMAATVGRRREMGVETSTEYKFAERQVTVLGTTRKAIHVHDVGDSNDAGPILGLITQ